MDITPYMDAMLANVAESGRKPQNFIVREDDWFELVNRYGLSHDPKEHSAPRYKGVPVEFGQVSDQMIVALYDTQGKAVVEEG